MSRDRLFPDWPVPAYVHVPGRTPHPNSDSAGHRHPTPEVGNIAPAAWRQCPAYLHGIDLFDLGFYWEAHEAWEQLWHALGRRGNDADFVKALIQLAVAGVKHLQGMSDSMRSHAKRAAELFANCGDANRRGIDVKRVMESATNIANNGWPASIVIPLV